MRQIEVDLDVFALIWANRRAPESSENEILRRLLGSLTGTTAPEPKPFASTHLHQTTNESKELKSSKDSEGKEVSMPATFGKVRWVDDVSLALSQLGGTATLHRIYQRVAEIRRQAGRSVPKSLDATVRQTIESHSLDSEIGRKLGKNVFTKVSRGEWALRDWVRVDSTDD